MLSELTFDSGASHPYILQRPAESGHEVPLKMGNVNDCIGI